MIWLLEGNIPFLQQSKSWEQIPDHWKRAFQHAFNFRKFESLISINWSYMLSDTLYRVFQASCIKFILISSGRWIWLSSSYGKPVSPACWGTWIGGIVGLRSCFSWLSSSLTFWLSLSFSGSSRLNIWQFEIPLKS